MLSRTSYRLAIGRRIAAARTARGLGQQQIAEALEVHRRTVQQWEAGASMPSADDLGRLAEILEVCTDHLIGRPSAEGDVLLVDRRCLEHLLSSTGLDGETEARSLRIGIVANDSVAAVGMREFGDVMVRAHEHLENLRRSAGDTGDAT